jgi:predicted porin
MNPKPKPKPSPTLLCATLMGLVVLPSLAQTSPQAAPSSSVSMYGVVDLAAYAKQLSGDAKLKTLQSGGMTTSRLGLAGTEDLGGGLRALFDVSGFIRADTGDSGRNATDPFWARGAFVGLSSAQLGMLRLGRIPSATFVSEINFGAFLDSANLNPYTLHTFQPSGTQPMITGSGALDSAWSNSIAYTLPAFSGLPGLSASVQVAAGEGGTAGRRVGGGVTYRSSPYGLSVTFDNVEKGTLAAGAATAAAATLARPLYTANTVQTRQGGAYVDFKVVKIMAQMAQTTFKNATPTEITLKTTALSATAPVGLGSVLVEWARTDNSRTGVVNLKRETLSVGYDYNLSLRSDLYAVALQDKVSSLARGTGYAVGVRHRF